VNYPKDDNTKARLKSLDSLIIYAHNMDFDFKLSGGWQEMIVKRGWTVDGFYFQGKVFIMSLIKRFPLDDEGKQEGTLKIQLWDTANYFNMTLKSLGKGVGCKKMDLSAYGGVTNQRIPDKVLSEYCKNDVLVCYTAVRKLIDFLVEYDVTSLRPTAASLAIGALSHKFYDQKENPICIHAYEDAVELERDSYKGGVTDCFQTGVDIRGEFMLLDINSMYPHIMKSYKSPVELVIFRKDGELKGVLNAFTKEMNAGKYDIIADCYYELPKEYAYILSRVKVKKEKKCLFVNSKGAPYWEVLSTPEIQFVQKYGKIHSVRRIAIYRTSHIFDKYVDFFYGIRKKFDNKKSKDYNGAFALVAKTMLNSCYGRFAMHDSEYVLLEEGLKPDVRKWEVYDCDLPTNHNKVALVQMGDKLYAIVDTNDNSRDSFVAVASLITARARMLLVEMILAAGRENVFYCDTDSVIIKAEAEKRLGSYIDDGSKKLGLLKCEGRAESLTIYRPKFYEWNDYEKAAKCLKEHDQPCVDCDDHDACGEIVRKKGLKPYINKFKCKGKTSSAEVLEDDDDKLVVRQDQWEKISASLRAGNLDLQRINKVIKTFRKVYSKGHVDECGRVYPFTSREIGINGKTAKPISI
jgi:hypothetical protein